MSVCPHCGAKAKKPRAKRKPRAIAMGGRSWPGQASEYAQNMQVKRGALLWDELQHADRFGARGDFVDPGTWLAHRLPLDELRAAVESGAFEHRRAASIIAERERRERFAMDENEAWQVAA